MLRRRWLMVGWGLAAGGLVPACTQILGDDFTIESTPAGGSSASGGAGAGGGVGATGGVGAGGGTGGEVGGQGGTAQGDFSFFITPPAVNVPYDGLTYVAVEVVHGSGFEASVTVEVEGAPNGLVWDPIEIAEAATTGELEVGASGALSLGTEFDLSLRATSGELVHSDTVSAVVTGKPGTVDESFGTAGITAWTLGSDGGNLPAIREVAQGKILVAGSKMSGLGAWTFAGARLLGTGALDTSFDTDGIVGASFCSCTSPSFAIGVSRSVGGKVYLVGSGDGGSAFTVDLALLRLKDDGTPDDDVAHDSGINLFDLGGLALADSAHAMEPDANDLPTVTGEMNDQLFVARIGDLEFGALDDSFGTDGYVRPTLPETPSVGRSLAIDTTGNIVVAGTIGATPDVLVLRFTPAGALDTTFATGGVLRLERTGIQSLPQVKLRPDGRIVVAATTDELGGNDILLVQLLAAGAPDPDFGTAGVALVSTAPEETVAGLALMLDGRIVVAANDPAPRLARFRPTGAPDPTFGTDGQQGLNLGIDAEIGGLTLASDDKILLGGTRQSYPTQGFVARLWN